jgi:hypothetical protein
MRRKEWRPGHEQTRGATVSRRTSFSNCSREEEETNVVDVGANEQKWAVATFRRRRVGEERSRRFADAIRVPA